MDSSLAWLRAASEPSIRYRVLTDLEGRSEDDADVQAARSAIPGTGWGARLLEGLEVPEVATGLYVPKYEAPYHRLLVLAEMGAPATHPQIAALASHVKATFAKPGGGFGSPRPGATAHLCVTGNLVRALIQLGAADDPQVIGALDWLVDQQLSDGGWHCWPEKFPHGTLDAWEALAAFAAVPERLRTPRIRQAVARGVEFLLAHNLGLDAGHAPWMRFHYPRHYYYDVLVGLDLVTSLGYGDDPRLAPALAYLKQKRDEDGRWALDAHHPDLAPDDEYAPHPPQLPLPVTPLALETPGRPSLWITLMALRVLQRTRA